ncbi:DNA cytosine methyltransferase [Paracoccus homiensis]|uniref:DNA cytosine methyltransferase n=1 Tax=Paracoccus homiensis TaxID=364199 RepID=UPI00398C980F
MSSKYSVVSMFSGCGGMDLGLLGGFKYLGKKFPKNPFEIKWANDLNAYACATYAHNLKHGRLCCTNRVMAEVPPSPDGLIPQLP